MNGPLEHTSPLGSGIPVLGLTSVERYPILGKSTNFNSKVFTTPPTVPRLLS